MVNPVNSYRRIVQTSSVIAGASLINILASFFRMKVAAIVLGPAGIGVVGLFQNLIATAASIASLGVSTVGTRLIAESSDEPTSPAMIVARKALAMGSVLLAVIGMLIVWLLRDVLAKEVLDHPGSSQSIGWLSIGVALTVLAGAQSALLNGMRRIADLALLSIVSGVLSTLAGVGLLLLLGAKGIVGFVLVIPVMNFLVGHWLTSRIPLAPAKRIPIRVIASQWSVMAKLGIAVVLASASFGLAQLALRSLVIHKLGPDALGNFQASWVISVIYAGLVFQAMGADYYPRLSASIGDSAQLNKLVNEQAEIVLLLASPVFIMILALSPWIIKVAYSASFVDATELLRWQVLGDIVKVAGWPLGFINLVMGDSRKYLLSEVLPSIVLVSVTWIALPWMGLQATGLAFFAMNIVYLMLVLFFASGRVGFAWLPRVRKQFALVLMIACAIFLMSRFSILGSALFGVCAAFAIGLKALGRLATMTGLDQKLEWIMGWYRRCISWRRGD